MPRVEAPLERYEDHLAKHQDLLQAPWDKLDCAQLSEVVFILGGARQRLQAERRRIRLRDPARYAELTSRGADLERALESALQAHRSDHSCLHIIRRGATTAQVRDLIMQTAAKQHDHIPLRMSRNGETTFQ